MASNFLAKRVAPDVLDAEYEAANKMVSDLNQGQREWMMSIPARPDYDPDLVISTALWHQHNEIIALRAALAATQEQATFTDGPASEDYPGELSSDGPYKCDFRDRGSGWGPW